MKSHPITKYPSHLSSPSQTKPFLKWAGGKQRLLPILTRLTPHGSRLIEPFVGAGSLSLATNFDSYLINDANPDLIEVWSSLKHRPKEFIERASSFFSPEFSSEDAYVKIRDDFNFESDRFERAVRFIYLNRFGYNGMYRVNNLGCFNVPYGRPKRLPAFPFEALERAALKLAAFDIRCGGYGHILEDAGEGDVVYCDPPYLSSKETVSSVSYTADRFGLNDFKNLVLACETASRRGAKVLLSQIDSELSRTLLKNWVVFSVEVRSSIASLATSRTHRRELIALST